jgi:short-subunit dehydrogenase
MEINKEYLEKLLEKEITDFKVVVNNNGIVEVKVIPKSSVKEIEVMININKSDENVG